MDLNDLNKSQIVLLTLLVSFVTSIATGIVTVTLIGQAPTGVTQTINRVVERTIEKVVPADSKITVREVPVIVTEEKLIVDVINKTSPGVARIVDTSATPATTIGTGFFLSADGLLATAATTVGDSSKHYAVALEDGQQLPIEIIKQDKTLGIALAKISFSALQNGQSNPKKIISLKLATEAPAVGQTVIAIGSTDSGPGRTVSISFISGLTQEGLPGDVATSTLKIKSNSSTAANVGGPLLNIKGEVVGLNTETGISISAQAVSDLIDWIKK